MKYTLSIAALMFLGPLATHAIWWQLQPHPRSWADANWSSAGILPAPEHDPGAVVHVMAGRAGAWKGIFAHHTWIVMKPERAQRYTRYDVVGWGRPVHVDGWAPDGRWFGDTPKVLLTLRGEDARQAIPRVRSAIAAYPHSAPGSYLAWPGPNSNTFISAIARDVPELASALLPTAIGKDFSGWLYAGATPSGTGVQLSLAGLAGISIGWIEGIEINVLGLVAGLDLRRPALKLPGWGRVGLPNS